jgi:RNA polymerase sigma-70 factor (ECF subfamily)
LLDETQILAEVRNGKTDAFTEIVERYQMPIQRYLYRLTGDYAMSQDIAQQTFVQAFQNILKTTNTISFRSWLYRIATNNAWQYSRRKRLINFIHFNNNDTLPAMSTPDSTVDNLAVKEALLKVPEKLRSCMVLHFVEGLKYNEIGETLGISEDAVRKRVKRGRQIFKKMYAGDETR